MSCDVCGIVTTELVALRDCYQTPNLKMVCPKCEKQASELLAKVRQIALHWAAAEVKVALEAGRLGYRPSAPPVSCPAPRKLKRRAS